MNDHLKKCGSPNVASQHAKIERLAEYPSPTHDAVAPESARLDHKRNAPASNGKIRGTTQIPVLYGGGMVDHSPDKI
ncbi:hypothetical protein [Novosphingobium cyanobacteriorum]|uniref:Transposase n=1 Tax=Novosphingobium cyanobacteriorum TaxID=3024215 RepID=A0ABT6CNP7_9SPHN|nr:hypothetical protein [Novosphingobium cyanobacteriorum]MDF8335530.1 hypothetical protein [Novosphingobium cyanobacteriorum]